MPLRVNSVWATKFARLKFILKIAESQAAGIASSSVHAVEATESRDYSILVFRDYRLEIQATTAGRAGGLRLCGSNQHI